MAPPSSAPARIGWISAFFALALSDEVSTWASNYVVGPLNLLSRIGGPARPSFAAQTLLLLAATTILGAVALTFVVRAMGNASISLTDAGIVIFIPTAAWSVIRYVVGARAGSEVLGTARTISGPATLLSLLLLFLSLNLLRRYAVVHGDRGWRFGGGDPSILFGLVGLIFLVTVIGWVPWNRLDHSAGPSSVSPPPRTVDPGQSLVNEMERILSIEDRLVVVDQELQHPPKNLPGVIAAETDLIIHFASGPRAATATDTTTRLEREVRDDAMTIAGRLSWIVAVRHTPAARRHALHTLPALAHMRTLLTQLRQRGVDAVDPTFWRRLAPAR